MRAFKALGTLVVQIGRDAAKLAALTAEPGPGAHDLEVDLPKPAEVSGMLPHLVGAVAGAVLFMVARPQDITVRDPVIPPNSVDI